MVRFKNRYMVVRLSCTYDNFNISDKELQFTVLNTIKTLFGDFGVGAIKTCFKVHYCNPTTKIIILKTRHGPHKFLSTVIPFVNELQGKPIKLSTLYTGASLFQCYKFIQKYQKNIVRELQGTLNLTIEEKMLNVTGVLKFNKFQINS